MKKALALLTLVMAIDFAVHGEETSKWISLFNGKDLSGWTARGGFTVCPYVLDDNPWGSSSG